MAKAAVNIETYTKPYTEVVTRHQTIEEKSIALTLTEEEATTLSYILSRVGGSPDGVRGNADKVLWALKDVGVDYVPSHRHNVPAEFRLKGHLTFAGPDGLMPGERA
jgi:hypothetical protein